MSNELTVIKSELNRALVLFEDLASRFEAVTEPVNQALGQSRLWTENQYRLDQLEANQKNLIKTIGEHSRQLKKLMLH